MKIAYAPSQERKNRENSQKIKDFLASPDNRRKRRKIARVEVVIDPALRNRVSARPCTLRAFKRADQLEIELRRAQRAELMKIKIHQILPECAELRFILGATKIRNAWALSQAETLTIAAIPGMGSVRAGKLHAYLTGRGIPVKLDPNTRVVR